jgi:hypothetical protein
MWRERTIHVHTHIEVNNINNNNNNNNNSIQFFNNNNIHKAEIELVKDGRRLKIMVKTVKY